MKFSARIVVAIVVVTTLLFAAAIASASTVLTVVSTADINKAGGGSSTYSSNGTTPPSLDFTALAGESFTFSVTGTTSCGGFCPTWGPDGDPSGQTNSLPLWGVFLGGTFPSSGLVQSSAANNVGSLSPSIGEIFFVGDGLTGTGTGTVQTFYIPTGATHLYFGFVDSPNWYSDNSGSLDITANLQAGSTVPEPSTLALMATGLGLGCLRKKRQVRH